MYFYEVAILASPLSSLTYHFDIEIKIGTLVDVVLRNKTSKGVVVSTCQKPEFKTNEIVGVSEFFYSKKQVKLATFISNYYFSSLGEALGLMTPYDAQAKASHRFQESKATDNNGQGTDGLPLAESSITLSKKQNEALSSLQKHNVSLLFSFNTRF